MRSINRLALLMSLVFAVACGFVWPFQSFADVPQLDADSLDFSEPIALSSEELEALRDDIANSDDAVASEPELASEDSDGVTPASTRTINLSEGKAGTLYLSEGDFGNAYFTLRKSATVALWVNLLSSSQKCLAMVENEDGDGFLLGSLSGTGGNTSSGIKGSYGFIPIMLPAGTYHINVYASTSGYYGFAYKSTFSSDFDDTYYQFEFEDNSSIEDATVLDSRWAFYGSLYSPFGSLSGRPLFEMDCYKFSTDGTQRIALTYVTTGNDYVVVYDANGEIARWGGLADADELLWQTSSSGGKYFYNFGQLPAGDYYFETMTPDTGSVAHIYAGWLGNSSIGLVDMSPETPHFRDVDWLAANMISYGWERTDGWNEFRPYANVARQDMAAFLFRLAAQSNSDLYDYSPSAQIKGAFKDVSSSTSHCDEVWWLAESGISEGWVESDGLRTFRGMKSVTRCDMAAFLYRLAGSPEYTPSAYIGSYFSDINEKTPHYKEVLWLAEQGVSKGWTNANGTHSFKPYATVARCDMAAFLHRMSNSGLV